MGGEVVMPSKKRLLQAALRRDFYLYVRKVYGTVYPGEPYVPNWHIDAMAYHLEKCISGASIRSIMNVPPRSMKSLLASVALPTFLIGHDPTIRIGCVSYSEDLASLFRDHRRQVMTSPWYRELFPSAGLIKHTEMEAVTRHSGTIITSSIHGGLTGRGFHWLIIDDPIKTGEAMSEAERNSVNSWMRDTAYSRLDRKDRDRILIVMQRVHCDDLVGFVEERGTWDKLVLKAIATEEEYTLLTNNEEYRRDAGEALQPLRESVESLRQTENFIGTYNFEAQYQQDPLPPGGTIIDPAWFRRYTPNGDMRHRFERTIQSWDTAAGDGANNAYSSCITFGIIENRAYILEVYRDKLTYPNLRYQVIHRRDIWGADAVLMEKASTGLSLLQELYSSSNVNLIAIQPKFDKETRAHQATGAIQSGRVYLPEDARWLAEFIRELRRFPAKPCDQVDALSQFINWWQFQKPRELKVNVYYVGGGGRVEPRSTWYSRNGRTPADDGW